jgi:hypothetical protein
MRRHSPAWFRNFSITSIGMPPISARETRCRPSGSPLCKNLIGRYFGRPRRASERGSSRIRVAPATGPRLPGLPSHNWVLQSPTGAKRGTPGDGSRGGQWAGPHGAGRRPSTAFRSALVKRSDGTPTGALVAVHIAYRRVFKNIDPDEASLGGDRNRLSRANSTDRSCHRQLGRSTLPKATTYPTAWRIK